MKYEFLEHTADMKFRARGQSVDEAFEAAVLAFSHFVSKGMKIKSKKKKVIDIEGTDLENLLYNFLDELIYLLDAENFVVRKGEVKIKGKVKLSPPIPRPAQTPTSKLGGKILKSKLSPTLIEGGKVKQKLVLSAVLWGDDVSNYKGLDHIKAATYAEMYIHEDQKGWEVQAVMDV